jgi:uncharacterized protein (DUF608 family)
MVNPATAYANPPGRLFPPHLLHATWHRFWAAGYSQPVTGAIYRGEPRPTCGLSLGGVDTGCLDIEPNGFLGYSTIFNHLIEPRLLLNVPFLGLHCDGHAWVLASDRQGKRHAPRVLPNPPGFLATIDYTPLYSPVPLTGVDLADSIDYWGHYPIADLEFNTSAPVEVGLRAWSPFLPGDDAGSLLPGAVFSIIVRNPSSQPHSGGLVLSFPGFETPDLAHHAAAPVTRDLLHGEISGVHIQSGLAGDAWEMAYVLGVVGEPAAATGGALNADGSRWAAIASGLPAAEPGETGASLALSYALQPGEQRTYQVVLAWHAPHWRAGGAPAHENTHQFTHMHARYYPDALSTARHLAREHGRLLQRVIAWQEVLYQDDHTPGWLADALINVLHLITECSVWGQAQPPLGAWVQPDDGLFAMNECPRGCPQLECLPCSFYGNIPLVYFFPRAARSTLRGYHAYQFADGRPPWIFGGVTALAPENRPPYDLSRPDAGYQTVLNGACYITMADRYWRIAGEQAILPELYESLKRCNDFSMNLRPSYGLSQIMAMPTPGTDNYVLGDTEWFEAPEPGWHGYVTHAGGVRMAQVQIMRRMAQTMGDTAYTAKCDAWLAAGAQALEGSLWNGTYYLNFNEPETGKKSDLVFGYQLDGQWITDWHGVPGAFPAERAASVLRTLRAANCALSSSGATNYANPDGTPARVGGYGTYSYFTPELFMLAMTYMYAGEREFGLQLLERCLSNLMRWGYLWDWPNLMRGDADTGQRGFGADYYQNLMLWAVPAALAGQDLAGPAQPGGLVARVIRAARD